jgi:PAS domain S-box-containing protein
MAPEATTVVLVDDSPEVRSLVRTHLRLSGRFTVVGEGGTGLDAVALAEQHRPALMLLDVSMPQMDGLAALPRVLDVSPTTRVVLFSGFDERGLAGRGRDLGALAFLEKSLPVDRLAEDLLELLGEPATPGVSGDGGDGVGGDSAGGVGASGDGVARARPGTPSGTGSEAPRAGRGVPEPPTRVLGEDLERFREVFEEAAIGMATMTLTGHVVRANRFLAALVDRPVTGLVGTDYAELAAADAVPALRRAVEDLNRGEAEVVQVEHGLAGGPARRLAATLAVVRGERGRPLYLFLQAQDVSEQRAAAERLRQSEERFRLLVEAVEDYAIFMLDPQGRVASWNAGAQRIKGYTAQEIVGQHFRRFYPVDKQGARHPEHELDLALRDGHYEEEGWRVRKDGTTFWANVVITAVRNAAGEHVGFAKITRDITERRHATEQQESAAAALTAAKTELEEMNARLVRAAADQSQFLAVTAHELRTPVTVLAGSADTLTKHWAQLDDSERTELFEGMASSAARLRRLLAELLTASRLEAGAVELDVHPVPVGEVLSAAAAAARRSHPGAQIELDADVDLAVLADRDRLAQAVDNLIGNALRHGAPPVGVSAAAGDDGVVVRVSDHGPGVAEAVLPRLFERFATGEQRRGTGLGLFIVRELARRHGGDAWYEPADGTRPTAFALRLPRA